MRENLAMARTRIEAYQTHSKTYPLPIGGRLEIWVIAALLFALLAIPIATAQEDGRALFQNGDHAEPVVKAETSPEAAGAMTQALDAQFPQESLDFLMDSPTLSKESVNAAAGTTLSPEPEAPAVTQPLPATPQDPTNPEIGSPEAVAMLVSEQCSQTGTPGDGTTTCERSYSNGHHATILTQNANEGDEIKSQTVIDEFDENGTLLSKKTIRHRLDYNYYQNQKSREKEFFDITYQLAGAKTTRELMVYEYYLDTGKTRSLAWTQYQQIGNEPKAGLTYHALLKFNEDGTPERGLAEKWNSGKKQKPSSIGTVTRAALRPWTWKAGNNGRDGSAMFPCRHIFRKRTNR